MEKVYRKNNYNQRYYNYYQFEIDDSMKFNEKIHKTYHLENDNYHPLQCGYCGYFFQSRNKLFNHLGFMNIDIRPIFYQILNVPDSIVKIAQNIRYLENRKRKIEWEEENKKRIKN